MVVEDSGNAFKEHEKYLLFNENTQLSSNKWLNLGGCGISLSYCFKVLQKLGGNIWANINPETGSSFGFEIPCVVLDSSVNIYEHMSKTSPSSIEQQLSQQKSNWFHHVIDHSMFIDDVSSMEGPPLSQLANKKVFFIEKNGNFGQALKLMKGFGLESKTSFLTKDKNIAEFYQTFDGQSKPVYVVIVLRLHQDYNESLDFFQKALKEIMTFQKFSPQLILLSSLDVESDHVQQAISLGFASLIEEPLSSENLETLLTQNGFLAADDESLFEFVNQIKN